MNKYIKVNEKLNRLFNGSIFRTIDRDKIVITDKIDGYYLYLEMFRYKGYHESKVYMNIVMTNELRYNLEVYPTSFNESKVFLFYNMTYLGKLLGPIRKNKKIYRVIDLIPKILDIFYESKRYTGTKESIQIKFNVNGPDVTNKINELLHKNNITEEILKYIK